ncbi:MAG: OmpA family protein [Lewinellaceae bacterium]|nr:OmpA family protein [Saprospiraceae bacterium]MCB9339147.1 OmpA family protein [Lewinellaceae bacterium]
MKQFKLFALLLMLPFLSQSQDKWEGGLFLGYSNYLGDLVEPTFTFSQPGPSFGILVRNHLTNTLGLRLNLQYGKIKGDDANYDRNADRGASFKSSWVELALMGEYELLGNRRWTEDGKFRKTVSPYVYGGVGGSFFDPNVKIAQTAGKPDKNNPDIGADYSNVHFILPIGAGLRFDLSRKVNLGLELGARFTFSDYIDGISKSGDPDDNDVFVTGGLVIGYRFGDTDADNDGVSDENDKCPTIPGPAGLDGCPDRDADGIADRDDNCPDDAGEIRMNGCPDRDGDGIADNVDDCPDEAGLRRFSGCPDTDNDNIVDKEDNCPTVPGLPAMNGCPDADRDGITDEKDECPNDPGTAEHGGCPDTDNDGIADREDNCPDKAGPRKFNGCPDSDNDGIDDTKDKCPLLFGLPSNEGCPEIKEEDKATLVSAMKNVQFETGSSKLLPSSLTVLNQIVELMSRYPGYKLKIDGYTDNVGNDFANQQLSEARAKTCFDYLGSKGVDKNIMSFTGHGESNPISSNETAVGRRQNRRVEFTLVP